MSDETPDGEPSEEGQADDERKTPADSAGPLDRLLGGPGPGSAPERDLVPAGDADVPAGDADVPVGLRAQFWFIVLLIKVGLLAAALGAMLVAFRGDWSRGGPLLLVGGLLLTRAYQRVRAFQREHASGE